MRFMKPLSRLFRTTPTLPDGVERRAATLESGSPRPSTGAGVIAREEAERAAAIGTLEDGVSLRQMAGLTDGPAPPANLERAAQQRMAQLIDTGSIDFVELCSATREAQAVLNVAGYCHNPEHLPAALALIADPASLARLAAEGTSSRLRQLAAQRIEDPAELRRLLKQVRDKDKNVYKIVKQKCDVLRAEEQRGAQFETEAGAACASLERHSHRIHDAIYEASFRHYESRWRSVEMHASADGRGRAERAIERCREIMAAHERKRALEAEDALRRTALRISRQTARAEGAAGAGAHAGAPAVAAADAGARAHAEAPVAGEAPQRHDDALAAVDTAKVPEVDENARAAASTAAALRQIGKLIGRAHRELRDGQSGRAAGLRRAIGERLAALPVRPAHLTAQVLKLDAKLDELKAWKDYAVAPKRAELIEAMEALIGSSEEPKALAERIRQLQDDWKTISKGIVSDSEADWQRFHQAATTAYQPCRDYFEAQALQRAANLEKRRSVHARLQAFEAAQGGENPDWRAIAQVLREAPLEWRRHFPVDRASGQAVQREFDAACTRLQTRLDAWHADNVAQKKLLIQRASQLRAKDDGRDAVDGVKRLQLQWKAVGAVPRDQDQPLWEEFREQCDAVFQKRQQAHAEYAAGLEANKAQAVALCEAAERVAALDGAAVIEGAAGIPGWRAAFEALGELPRAEQRALNERFERALKRCQSTLLEQRARDRELSFANLLEAASRINAYAWGVAQAGAPADLEARKQAAEAFIADVPNWPKGAAAALQESWTCAEAASRRDPAAAEAALRMLCIRSEILADRPTPAEDQSLRREYQVQRLVKRMEHRDDAPADASEALAFEWVRIGPVEPSTYARLLARFRPSTTRGAE
jgi:hypothetical protein